MQLNRDNELLIPADGDCLYTSAFVAYLLPVRINGAQFHMRLQKLLKINITESLAEIFREKFIRYLGNVNFYRTPEFKKLIKKFKANINVHNQWGGAAEIKIISEYLEINIQEFIENPEDGVPYVQSDIAQYLADGPDQLNTIFILRAVPEFVEAIQPSADIEMQIAQMESVAESQQHAQHYRLFLSNPLNVPLDVSTRKISDKKDGEDDESGSDNSSTEAPEIGAGENGANNVAIPNLNFIRLILAISTASRAFTFLQSFFSFSLPIPNLMIAMATVLSDTHKEGTLLSKAPEFVENMPLFRHPSLKVSEFNSIWILITRVLMVMYRDCFEVLMTSEPISSDLCFKVFDNFLRKIIGSGDLDTYYVSAKNKIQQQIEAEPENKSQHEAMLEFFEGFIRFLRYIGSEAVNDPAQDPLNAYVNLKWISEVNQIDEWLEKNPGHPDYKDEQNRARKLGDFIASRRFQKMRELGEHVFSLLKQMEPELADIGNPSDLIPYIEAEHQKRTRKEFENYLLNDFKKFDIFEPNQLRAFEEQLQRYQYGKIYYEIVCESFQDEFKESRVHRVAQIVWAVSQLDTIHEVPQEARSRMPVRSSESYYAPNFGYEMPRSEAYQNWITNPLVRACGDVIVDAYHYSVSFGINLDIGLFLKYFESIFDHPKNHIFPPEYDEHDGSCIDCAEYCELGRTYSKYHDFAFPFARYLLENIFEIEFVNGENIFDQLRRVVRTKEDFLSKAEEALKALQVFSKHMLRLRPSQASAVLGKSEKLGLVFGIGFNGELFNSPFHSESDESEIWINFSASGREGGGHLLLTFIGHVAQWGGNKLFGVSNITAALERYFEKYKILIEMKLDELCEYFARSPELTAKYTRFLNECKCLADEKIAFASLSQEFKDWLCDPANLWYSIPAHPGGIKKIKIKIPPNMEKYEHNAQIFARELLFDVLTQPAFFKSEIYHHLMPYLFQHWRKEILVELGRKNLTTMMQRVEEIREFENLSPSVRPVVIDILNQLVSCVHSNFQEIWKPAIAQQLKAFKEEKLKQLNSDMAEKERKIAVIQKKLRRMAELSTLDHDLILVSKNGLQKRYKVNNFTYILSDEGIFYVASTKPVLGKPICTDSAILTELKGKFGVWEGMSVPDSLPERLSIWRQENITRIIDKTLRLKIQTMENELILLVRAAQVLKVNIRMLDIEIQKAKASREQGQGQIAWSLLQNQLFVLSQADHEDFKDYFFGKRRQERDVSPELDVSQCVEPLFARVLGHDHFFSVYISKLTGKTLIRDGIGEESPPLQLGSHTPQDVIPPCSNRCQYHVLGHVYTGDMLGFQSVEQLDERRRVHNLGEVPDRFLGLGTLSPAAEDNQTVADGAAASARSSNVYGSPVDFWDPPVMRPPTEAGELVIDEAEQRAMRERKRAGDDHPHVMR